MQLWTRTAPGRFLVREWDGTCVIFDLLSNDTHACDTVATAVVRELGCNPADTARLFRGVAAALDCPCDAELAALATQALEDLERLGVAERCTP